MTIRDDRMVNEILKNGGITLDCMTNKTMTDSTGYMVSLANCEEKHNINVFKRVGKILIDVYIENNRGLLLTNSDLFLGVWIDGQDVYFDISQNIKNIETAILYGKDRKQLAIFDLANMTAITL